MTKTIDFWKLFSMTTKGDWTAFIYKKDPSKIGYSGLVRTESGHIIARDCSADDAKFIAAAHQMLPKFALQAQLDSIIRDASKEPVSLSSKIHDTILLDNLISFLNQMCRSERFCPFEDPALCPFRDKYGCFSMRKWYWEEWFYEKGEKNG